ncbi:MAG TPA: papain-like cysteine protease family protein [Fibrobacteria bacterium]|nr:papain-like cysteine protease family protein [Fibrobacteria bacterium]HOX52818.1 papain-like cysteine protease family protein [Fibrobacteria bacterium]
MKTSFKSLLAVVALAALPVLAAEDCIGFSPANTQATLVNGTWKVVDGGMWLMDFGSGATGQTNATKARDIIKFYGLNQQCFVGRPNAPMMYFKVNGAYPTASYPGEDAIYLNPYNAQAKQINGTWKVVDCSNWLLDFGASQTNAQTAAALIKNNHLRKMCFVGRPGLKMMYFLQDNAYRPYVSRAVTLRPQQTGMWCWAASGQMAMEYLGSNVAQCTQANNRFGRGDCCNGSSCPLPNCVTGGWPEFSKYGFSSQVTSNTALSWDELWNQLNCGNKPVAFSWAWTGGGGHMMVVRGAQILSDGTKMVQISDPWAPCAGDVRWITYAAYVSQSGSYTHWNDYYNITRN